MSSASAQGFGGAAVSHASVCNPPWPLWGVCGRSAGRSHARRARPLPSHLAKEDHNECPRMALAQDSGDRAVSDSASPAAEWTHTQGNPQGPLALPLNQAESKSDTSLAQGW